MLHKWLKLQSSNGQSIQSPSNQSILEVIKLAQKENLSFSALMISSSLIDSPSVIDSFTIPFIHIRLSFDLFQSVIT